MSGENLYLSFDKYQHREIEDLLFFFQIKISANMTVILLFLEVFFLLSSVPMRSFHAMSYNKQQMILFRLDSSQELPAWCLI